MGTIADPGGIFFRSNKQTREQLSHIIDLCVGERPVPEIQAALSELDGSTSQLLGNRHAGDPQLLAVARSVLAGIPCSAPNRRGARRQFIGDLHDIFQSATPQHPTRRVRIVFKAFGVVSEEYGRFLDFVKAVLNPFKAARGCVADMRPRKRERVRDERKNAVAAKR